MRDTDQQVVLRGGDDQSLDTGLRSKHAPHMPDLEHPWIGLESFAESTRLFFFGRDAEIDELHLRLRNQPLLVLYGRSGLGKTSILRAGLIPRLSDEDEHPVILRLRYEDSNTNPCSQLVSATFGLSEQILGQQINWGSTPKSVSWVRRLSDKLSFCLPEDPLSLLWLRIHYRNERPEITHLILDQFEEVFTLGARHHGVESEVRDSLAILLQGVIPEGITRAIAEHDGFLEHFDPHSVPISVILALRDDFVYALNRWRRHLPALTQNSFELRTLRGLGALDAVYMPGALRCHYAGRVSETSKAETGLLPIISKDTAERIVRFIAKTGQDISIEDIEAVPPILSLLCRELNERRIASSSGNPTAAASQIGFQESDADIEAMIGGFYERCLANRPEAVRVFIEEELVSRSGARLAQDEKSILAVLQNGCEIPGFPDSERAAGFGDAQAARFCLDDLVNQRLLSSIGGMPPSYELVHDLLASVVEKSRTATRAARGATESERHQRAEQYRSDRAESIAEMNRIVKKVHWIAGITLLTMLLLWLNAEQRIGTWAAAIVNHADVWRTREDAKVLLDSLGIKVEVEYPAAILAALALVLVGYLRWARSDVLRLLAAVVRATHQLGQSEAVLSKTIQGAWWLAPLPLKVGSDITAQQLKSALGWHNVSRRNTLLVAVSSAAVAFMVCRFVGIGMDTKSFLRTGGHSDYWRSIIWPMLLMACSACALLQIYSWWRRREVLEDRTRETISAPRSRRQFLLSVVTALIAASIPILVPAVKRLIRAPRFRQSVRRSAPDGLPIGSFRHNLKSQIFHGVVGTGSAGSPGVYCLPQEPETMAAVLDGGVPRNIALPARSSNERRGDPRVQLSRAACAFTEAALLRLRSADVEGACQLLLGGVRHDIRYSNEDTAHRPSIHIYDFLAGLAVRHGQPQHLIQLAKLIGEAPTGSRSALDKRQAVWRNESSRWHKRWADKSKPLKWSGLLM